MAYRDLPAQRKAAKLCIDCGRPTDPEKHPVRCTLCKGALALRRKLLLCKGICCVCAKAPRRDSKTTCQACADRTAQTHKRFMARRKEQGGKQSLRLTRSRPHGRI